MPSLPQCDGAGDDDLSSEAYMTDPDDSLYRLSEDDSDDSLYRFSDDEESSRKSNITCFMT